MEERNVSLGTATLTATYEEENRPCEVCGSTAHWTLHERAVWRGSLYLMDRDGHLFHKTDVMCKKCGLVYKNPMFTEKSNELFNKVDYPLVYHSGNVDGISRDEISNSIIVAVPFLEWLSSKQIDVKNKTILDIGCGIGTIIGGLKSIGGIVTGVDSSFRNSEIGSKLYGINTIPASLFDKSALSGKTFDIVLIMNALEHFYSPRKVIMRAAELLNPGGKLIIEVPSMDSVYARTTPDGFLSSAHLYTFSGTTLGLLLNTCGFTVDSVDHVGHNKCMYTVASKYTNNTELYYEIQQQPDLEKKLEGYKDCFKEHGLLNISISTIGELVERGGDMEEVEERLDDLRWTSNIVRQTIALAMLESGKPDKAISILEKYDHAQSFTFRDNYGVSLITAAIAYIQLGDFRKGESLLVEAKQYSPDVLGNSFFKLLCLNGIASESMFVNTSHSRRGALLKDILSKEK